MIDRGDPVGVLWGAVAVMILLIVMNKIAELYPQVTGTLSVIAVGIVLVVPGASIAFRLFD